MSKREPKAEVLNSRFARRGYYNGEQIVNALKRGQIFVNAERINVDQVNPAGIDLTIFEILDPTRLKDPEDPKFLNPDNWPAKAKVSFNKDGFTCLKAGKKYWAGLNEVLRPGRISLEIEAKSSYTRGGCGIRNQYYGYSDSMLRSRPRRGFISLEVFNPYGFEVQRNAPIVQAAVYSDEIITDAEYKPHYFVSEPLLVGEVKKYTQKARYGINKADRNVNVTKKITPGRRGTVILKKEAPYLVGFTLQVVTLGPDKFTPVWPTSLISPGGLRILVYGAYGDPGFAGAYIALVVPINGDLPIKIGKPFSKKLCLEMRSIPSVSAEMLYDVRSGTYQGIGISDDWQKELRFSTTDSPTIKQMEEEIKGYFRDQKFSFKNFEDGLVHITEALGKVARNLRRGERKDFIKDLAKTIIFGFGLFRTYNKEGHKEILRKVEVNRRMLYRTKGKYSLRTGDRRDERDDSAEDLGVVDGGFTIRQLQEEIWKNKIRKDFNLEELELELVCMMEEIGEMATAYQDRKLPELLDALTDLIIYGFGLFEMCGVDGHKEIKKVIKV